MDGIGASSGIGIGKIFKIQKQKIEIPLTKGENVEYELKRYKESRDIAKRYYTELIKNTRETIGEDEAKIFEAHRMIVDDIIIVKDVEKLIKEKQYNAVHALDKVSKKVVLIFENIDDVYMKERATDIKDVHNKILRLLLGIPEVDLSQLDEETILIAHDLTPSETAMINKQAVSGIITEIGGPTSHTAIMSRSIEMCAVVGAGELLSKVNNGDLCIVDGDSGEFIINPSLEEIEKARKAKLSFLEHKKFLEKQIGLESITKDDFKVEICANIGKFEDACNALNYDCEGVGLFRTEFMYMNRTMFPTEEEQFTSYSNVLKAMENRTVVIRTLDIGGDKELDYLEMPKEMNPFLGYRAIRMCLDKKDLFRVHVRAILRASVFGKLKIMFPMISSLEEFREAKSFVLDCKEELLKEGYSVSKDIKIGIMVEIPSVAVLADCFAKEVDFFSIGTNDLIQYTTAVDRMNNQISTLYNPCHPSVLRLINSVIQASHKEGKKTGMCGEVAGDPRLIPVLIGMGLDEFSMSASSILNARRIIRNLNKKEMSIVANRVMNMSTATEVEKYLGLLNI